MIESLEDAWKWYHAVRSLAFDMRRLATKWDDPVLGEVLGRDNRFRELTAADLHDRAKTILEDINPLAVLVLFSVFEVTVRDRARADVDRETLALRHPALMRAVQDLRESIENGSFGRVLESYKVIDVDLTTQVNQVRKYRNWVAHGRRGKQPENLVEPDSAMDRLRRYLEEIERSTSIVLPQEALREQSPDRDPHQAAPGG